MHPPVLELLRNDALGIEAVIMEGNDRYKYRVVLRDTDADKEIATRFSNSYLNCQDTAYEFLQISRF